MARISASILSYFFEAKKKKESDEVMIKKINDALTKKQCDYDILHLDIMDGKFVDAKTFTAAQIRKIKCIHKKEAHFMVVDYNKYLHDFYPLADMFIFHNEVLKSDFPKIITEIKKDHKFVGISINPDTHIENIKYLDKIDLILVMSVWPGKPGQVFLDNAINKIKKLKEIRQKQKLNFKIEVDGGINDITAKKCLDAGADILVIGSFFFKGY